MERKAVLCKGVTRPPELPCASQLFIHFLTKTWQTIYKRNKKLAPQEGSPFFDGTL